MLELTLLDNIDPLFPAIDFDADGDGHGSSTIAKYDGTLGGCNDENGGTFCARSTFSGLTKIAKLGKLLYR